MKYVRSTIKKEKPKLSIATNSNVLILLQPDGVALSNSNY